MSEETEKCLFCGAKDSDVVENHGLGCPMRMYLLDGKKNTPFEAALEFRKGVEDALGGKERSSQDISYLLGWTSVQSQPVKDREDIPMKQEPKRTQCPYCKAYDDQAGEKHEKGCPSRIYDSGGDGKSARMTFSRARSDRKKDPTGEPKADDATYMLGWNSVE